MSHRRRWEKQREVERRRARITRLEFVLFFVTSLITFAILVALDAMLGRENAVGLCIAAGIFAVAFAAAALLVARDAGKESLRCQILGGIASGFAIGAVLVAMGALSWEGFVGASATALFIAVCHHRTPDEWLKRRASAKNE